jgi:hypothetical protein
MIRVAPDYKGTGAAEKSTGDTPNRQPRSRATLPRSPEATEDLNCKTDKRQQPRDHQQVS